MTDRDVYYFTRFVPVYRIPILERLNDRLDGKLVVCSGAPPPGSAFESLVGSSSPGYRQKMLRNWWFRGETLHYQVFGSAFSERPHPGAIIAEEAPRSLSLPRLLRRARSNEIPTLLWGHFSSNARELGTTDFRDRFRIRMAKGVDALICYTEQIADQIAVFVDPAKVFVARNTLDTTALQKAYDRLQTEGVRSVRERLSIHHDHVVVFLGRLIEAKGTDMLVETMTHLEDQNCLLLMIGDGPERASIEDMARSSGIDIHFAGALTQSEDLASHLFAADILLNPGYLGLSVVHAFAMGVPVIAPAPQSASRFHSPEWVYVRNGENGILVESPTADQFAHAVKTILSERERFSSAALSFANTELKVDRMIDGIIAAIDFATKGA